MTPAHLPVPHGGEQLARATPTDWGAQHGDGSLSSSLPLLLPPLSTTPVQLPVPCRGDSQAQATPIVWVAGASAAAIRMRGDLTRLVEPQPAPVLADVTHKSLGRNLGDSQWSQKMSDPNVFVLLKCSANCLMSRFGSSKPTTDPPSTDHARSFASGCQHPPRRTRIPRAPLLEPMDRPMHISIAGISLPAETAPESLNVPSLLSPLAGRVRLSAAFSMMMPYRRTTRFNGEGARASRLALEDHTGDILRRQLRHCQPWTY